MRIYACLLLCFISTFVWLDLGSCHALWPLWACAWWSLKPLACVVKPVPLVTCLGVNNCENTSPWCWFALCIPFLRSMRCYACLSYLVPPVWLSLFFASLRACLHVHAWVHVSRLYSNLMELWTLDSNLYLSSQDTPFCLITCLFALRWLSLIVFPLACFPSNCFFDCMLVYSFCLCMLTLGNEDAWSKGATFQKRAKKARMQARRHKPRKGKVQ